jgi:hypothetical protein
MIKLILAGTALASLATATLCFAGYHDGGAPVYPQTAGTNSGPGLTPANDPLLAQPTWAASNRKREKNGSKTGQSRLL